MKRKRLFVGFALLSALLCASCSDVIESSTAGQLPSGEWKSVPFAATVSDCNATRATLDNNNKYIFEAGDKLIIAGENIRGELTLREGDEGKHNDACFEGDIEYQGNLPSDATALTATLVSANDAIFTVSNKTIVATSFATTFCTTRAEAIQKLSGFSGSSTYGERNFSLMQSTAFLDFNITMEDGTESGASIPVSVINNGVEIAAASVTATKPADKVLAHFIVGVPGNTTLMNAVVQLDNHVPLGITDTKELVGNKFYNVVRTQQSTELLPGQFAASAGGAMKVNFAQGNLQATTTDLGATWTWSIAKHQWDVVGDAAANNAINGDGTVSENGTVDQFAWVGSSNTTWTGAAQYGITNADQLNSVETFGTGLSEGLKSDWGNTVTGDWHTPSKAEWNYMLNTRASGSTVNGTSDARYTYATINTDGTPVKGLIIFPDGVTIGESEATSWGAINGSNNWGTLCTKAQWAVLSFKGCVFLPAAGSTGNYWSATPSTASAENATSLLFGESELSFDDATSPRSAHMMVRLVSASANSNLVTGAFGQIGLDDDDDVVRATGYVNLSATSGEVDAGESLSFNVTGHHGGALSVSVVSGSDRASAYLNNAGTKVTVYTTGTEPGSATIRVTSGETYAYAATSTDFVVTMCGPGVSLSNALPGYVVTTDAQCYDPSGPIPISKTRAGVVTYKNGSSGYVLALVTSGGIYWVNRNDGLSVAPSISGHTWIVGSKEQYELAYTNQVNLVNSYVTNAGGAYYASHIWSNSTPTNDKAWAYWSGSWFQFNKNNTYSVLPLIAF